MFGEPQGQRAEAVAKTAVVGGLVNLGLAVIKVGAGVLWHSQALVADGIHSLSDLLSDVLVWYAGRHAARAPDQEHPYGHGRYETLATLVLGVFLLMVAVGIGWDAGNRLFAPAELLRPQPLALAAVLVSILVKEWLYWWTLGYARRVRSDMLRANAWHHRSDAVSSVVVLVGLVGTLMGLPYLDAIAAVVIAVMIAHIAWELGHRSIRELVDTGLEAERLAAIEKTIDSVGGVRNIHMLRTRRHGWQASVDVHILVDPRLSVSEGHLIALLVEDRLKSQIDEITDVTVHIDPEDDATEPLSVVLPTRAEALTRLERLWEGVPEATSCRRTILHYLNGRIDVEVYFPLAVCAGECSRAEAVRDRLQSALAADPVFNQVFVYFG
ncbi:cation diffusion facilitator family transporter [Candidatus Thiosymbion oneisti]|uniref:cation diffusion facilitator family transporter n=1 Tax=Candidatus Thiosymbion oneisti TaxID=589554 RepID=UPI000AFC2A9B|nr:cation diffusion facilitator family transporter [Candidatus Thiosymbion oneisti]